jgi:hypothetical protein
MGNLTPPSRLGATGKQRKAIGRTRKALARSAQDPFWTWFIDTIAPLGPEGLDEDDIVARIDAEFSKTYPDLAFELWGPDGGEVDFVISADGRTELFAEVLDAVRGAPRIPGWRIVAFRPRRSIRARVSAMGHQLSGDQVWYHCEPEDGRLRVSLFVEDIDDDNWDILCATSCVLLDMALGEFDAATKIASLEHYPMNEETRVLEPKPLAQLPEELDAFFAETLH